MNQAEVRAGACAAGGLTGLAARAKGKLYINFGFWDALEGPGTEGGNATAVQAPR